MYFFFEWGVRKKTRKKSTERPIKPFYILR